MKTAATVACFLLGFAICSIAGNSIANNAEVNEFKVKAEKLKVVGNVGIECGCCSVILMIRYMFAIPYTVKKGSRVSRPQPGCHHQTLPGQE
jgi:hypothetical protein